MLAIFTIEHVQVLCTDVNNSEIRYTKKIMYFPDRGVYTPYSPHLSTPLTYATTLCLKKSAPNLKWYSSKL